MHAVPARKWGVGLGIALILCAVVYVLAIHPRRVEETRLKVQQELDEFYLQQGKKVCDPVHDLGARMLERKNAEDFRLALSRFVVEFDELLAETDDENTPWIERSGLAKFKLFKVEATRAYEGMESGAPMAPDVARLQRILEEALQDCLAQEKFRLKSFSSEAAIKLQKSKEDDQE